MNNEELVIGFYYLCKYYNGQNYVFQYLGENNWTTGYTPNYFQQNLQSCMASMQYKAVPSAHLTPLELFTPGINEVPQRKPARCIN